MAVHSPRLPCILGTPTLLESISQSEISYSQVSVFLHWHHQKPLVHPLAVHSPWHQQSLQRNL